MAHRAGAGIHGDATTCTSACARLDHQVRRRTVILRQFLHTDPVVAASYLFGCGGKAAGAVVDPVEEPGFYLRAAELTGLRIRYVIDTHGHADHLSTGRSLAEAAEAAYVLHADAGAAFAFHGVRDGDRLTLGNVVAEVLHVPGHTPDHIALLVTDRARGGEPWFVATGHTLMVGDLGRTELASSAEAGANALFESAGRLRALPDHVEVLPGAFSGSVCGRGLSGKPSSTIGFERRANRAFAMTDREAFVAHMLREIPPPPPDAAWTRARNFGLEAVPASSGR
jgi:glyoxylase-like metal-dependent hydrolase (beta-lactamase superfamily II)